MPSSPSPAGDADSDDLRAAIKIVARGQSLSQEQSAKAFEAIMSGDATDAQIGALLMGLHVRGETVDEIAGAALQGTHRHGHVAVAGDEDDG